MFCRRCGSKIIEGASFCNKCGTPVTGVASEQPSVGGGTAVPPVVSAQDTDTQKANGGSKIKVALVVLLAAIVIASAGGMGVLFAFHMGPFESFGEQEVAEMDSDDDENDVNDDREDVDDDGKDTEEADIKTEQAEQEQKEREKQKQKEQEEQKKLEKEKKKKAKAASETNGVIDVDSLHTRSGYAFPDCDSVVLSSDDLDALSAKEMAYIRNEIYARYGYIFESAEYRAYFGNKIWYDGIYADQADVPLSATAKKNTEIIAAYESEHAKYSPDKDDSSKGLAMYDN